MIPYFNPFIPLIFVAICVFVVGLIWAVHQDSKRLSTMPQAPSSSADKTPIIKTLYFAAVSIIALFMSVFAAVDLINVGLRTWIFTKADLNEYPVTPCALQYPIYPQTPPEEVQNQIKTCEQSRITEEEANAIRKQKDAVRDLSLLVVGLPLFFSHWRILRGSHAFSAASRKEKKDA